jgi:hypothetical protein
LPQIPAEALPLASVAERPVALLPEKARETLLEPRDLLARTDEILAKLY